MTQHRDVRPKSLLVAIRTFWLAVAAFIAVSPAYAEPAVDAALYTNGKIYIFKGANYWRLSGLEVDQGYPKPLSVWSGMPSRFLQGIDAAVYFPDNGKSYFFKGSEYVRITGTKVDPGYPKQIAANWTGLPARFHADIDAALYRAGHVYLFKGDEYVRFTGTKMDAGYPKKLPGGWELPAGFRNGLSAALDNPESKKNYLFSSDNYVRLSDVKLDTNYPQSNTVWKNILGENSAASINSARDASNPGNQAPGRVVTNLPPIIFDRTDKNLASELTPPTEARQAIVPRSVILRGETYSEIIARLNVKRQLSLSNIQARPELPLGAAKIDFRPVLDNQNIPFNVAKRLRAAPQLVTVATDQTDFYEIDEGFVIRSSISYQIKPGVCASQTQRIRLSRAGVDCFAKETPQMRQRAFAEPDDPRYVADPAERARISADAMVQAEKARQEISGHIAQLRSAFADPAQRAELDARFGAGETARLAAMTDDQLTEEMMNTAETKIEEVMFIPNPVQLNAEVAVAKDVQTSSAPLLNVSAAMALANIAPANGDAPPAAPTALNDVNKVLPKRSFVTGFTLGEKEEWKKSIGVRVYWCWVGCAEDYYAGVYANFTYGIGLRFPIELGGKYSFKQVGDKKTASVVVNYAPINGTAADYRAAGLSNKKLFEGKEFVAEFKAEVGAFFKVPVIGHRKIPIKVGKDFTEGLPPPYTNGQFKPPAPSENDLAPLVKHFKDFDLLGGRANFGVVGALVFPSVKAQLESDSLRFTLYDQINLTKTPIKASGQVVDLGVSKRDLASRFTIGEPVYNLGFRVTPGLTARVFVDVAVWSTHKDWTAWFPQISVKLPPGGLDFACHAGTVCTRKFEYSPTLARETEGADSANAILLDQRAAEFENKWINQCLDDLCDAGIRLLKINATLVVEQKVEDFTPQSVLSPQSQQAANYFKAALAEAFFKADKNADAVIQSSKSRVTASEQAIWYSGLWVKHCVDQLCINKIEVIGKQFGKDFTERQRQNPDATDVLISIDLLKTYFPKGKQEVEASKARAETSGILAKIQNRLSL